MNSVLRAAFRYHLQNPQRVLFADNRLRFPTGFHAMEALLRARVADLMADINRAREKRAKLADGEYRDLYFWNGDKRLQEAFCDGANISAFPA